MQSFDDKSKRPGKPIKRQAGLLLFILCSACCKRCDGDAGQAAMVSGDVAEAAKAERAGEYAKQCASSTVRGAKGFG